MREMDLEVLLTLSIDRSICYLEKNVYSIREPDHQHGLRAEKFMETKHKLKTTERFLHKQVQHWKDRGLVFVRWNAFTETLCLPTLIMQTIKDFVVPEKHSVVETRRESVRSISI
jgi:hypothetical protein